MTDKVLAGKVAVVTGGSRSIGASIAKKLADQGATVVITYQNSSEKAQAVIDEIQAKGVPALAIQADAGHPEASYMTGAEILVDGGHTA